MCALLALALMPGCSATRITKLRSGWQPDRAPECTTDKRPIRDDLLLGGLFAVGGGVAGAAALDIIPTSYGDRKIASAMLPALLIPAAAFGASALVGYQRTNQCAVAEARWAAGADARQREALAKAEEARKAIQSAAAAREAEQAAAAAEARKAEEARRKEEAAAADKAAAAEEDHAAEEEVMTQVEATETPGVEKESVAPTTLPIRIPSTYRSTEGYQNSKWGMRRAEVKQLYPDAQTVDVDGLSLLGVQGKVAGHEAVISFAFVDDRLAFVALVLESHRDSNNKALATFNEMKRLLTAKYGKPVEDEIVRGDNGVLGLAGVNLAGAIALGHATTRAQWNTTDTYVEIDAAQRRMRIGVRITYSSRALRPALDAERDLLKSKDL